LLEAPKHECRHQRLEEEDAPTPQGWNDDPEAGGRLL
jgi:hypothetical protein